MLKNLASATPREFLVQTNKIRKIASEWLKATGIVDFNDLKKTIAEGGDGDDLLGSVTGKLKANVSQILDKMLEDDVDKTVELLCACCFVDPKDADKHPISEYLESIMAMLTDEAVLNFFISCWSVIQTNTSGTASK